ncbi:MAG: transcription initiation factor IIB [Candidatus Syntropharchaeia archaeon]
MLGEIMEENKKERRYREQSSCPECDSPNIIRNHERGEIFCEDCGLVIEEGMIDPGPDWRAFDSDQMEKRARAGAPMTYMIHDKGLSTFIDWKNQDSHGKALSSKERVKYHKLREWQKRISVSGSSEKSLVYALSEIERMASALGIPQNVRESAALMYRKMMEKKLVRGRSIEGLATAALYAACRKHGVPRTLDEMSEVSKVSQKEIGRAYRFISRMLGLKLAVSSPVEFVSRFCSKLNLDGEVRAKSMEILQKAEEKELMSGKDPISIVAAAIYIASILCGDHRTQKEVADATGVTEVTIRNRYRELVEALNIDLPF